MAEGEEFGQKRPPLSVMIKRILERYPDGQIFKEMIQNADDAGAKVVQFYVDCRQHGSKGLVKSELAHYQGPALISANDAKFTEEDWEGIQSLQQSIKAEDPFKVGRFGIGFNSVYHLTDVPSIISGDKIGFLEPQERIWDRESGRSFSLQQLSASDHLQPFHGISDFSRSAAHYPKTLFRFPLRSDASGLSANVYDVKKLQELIEALRSEAKYLLLFLRSVHTIEVFNIDSRGNQILSFQTKIADAYIHDFGQKRDTFHKQLKSCHDSHQYNFSRVISLKYKFDVCVYDSSTRKSTTSHWLIASRVDPSNSAVRRAAIQQKVFPWVGAAVELDNPGNGRIFCVLPMPIETASNLPVHVNGTFGINDDRRSLKWPGVERKNDIMAAWNQLLVKHVIPPCYIDLLLEAKGHLQDNFYKAWPDVERLKRSQWEALIIPVFSALLQNNVILSESGSWILPTAAVYAPKSGRQIAKVVKTSLTNCRVEIAEVPAIIWNAFKYTRTTVIEISPAYVRDCLRNSPNSYTNFCASEKLELLKYCISDGAYKLDYLQLLPLANGTFGTFQVTYPVVYICTSKCPRELLPGLDHKLVDLSSDADLQTRLEQVAKSNMTQLRVLEVSGVSTLLDEAMPASWGNADVVRLPNDLFNLKWLEVFWAWVRNKKLLAFQKNHILPVHCDTPSQFDVVKLPSALPVLYISNHMEYTGTMLSVLNKFGIKYCSQAEFPFVEHQHLSKVIKKYDIKNLLELIAAKGSFSAVVLSPEEAQYFHKAASQVELSRRDCAVLQQLQIFFTCTNSTATLFSIDKTTKHSLLKIVVRQPQNSNIDFSVMPASMIVFSSHNYYQNQLLSKLGYDKVLNDVEFLTRHVFPSLLSMEQSCIDGIMTMVLDKYQPLSYTSSEIASDIRNLQFVKVASGARKRPSDLFDPQNDNIASILRGEDVFPVSPYNSSKCISVLKLCGLHTSVTPQKVLDVISSISLRYNTSPQRVDQAKLQQSKAILRCIEDVSFQCSGSFKIDSKIERGHVTFSIALMLLSNHKCWLPVFTTRPNNYPSCLPWKGEDYTSHFISLNDSVCVFNSTSPSLPLACGSEAFFTYPSRHLDSELPVKCLVPHLKHVVAAVEHIPPNQMMPLVTEVYSAMQKVLQEGTDVDSLSKLKTMKEWIYIRKDHRFVGIGNVALSQNASFGHIIEPYLYVLPDSISAFSRLFKHFGMQDSISRSQIVAMLGLIKERISVDSSAVSSEAAWNSVMAILNWLTENGTKSIGSESVYVPLKSDSEWPDLVEPHNAVYTDSEFIKLIASSSQSGSAHALVHSKINQGLAKSLGIPSLSGKLGISEDTFQGAGQHEPLIVRLKNILRDYKDGLTIVKELIQNADDAGATEVNICYDARTHTQDRSKLLYPDMCESHGPALVVHNNGKFSDEDFENIQKLAAATKQGGKNLKIGKFGVGFCSVYHITDVPSFVSRDRLYIFDPTLQHLRNEVKNKSQPGQKVTFPIISASKQMEPYCGLFGFKHDAEYNGTLFRLPFRKSASELSTKCYSESTISDLVQSIKECGDKLLLFLQHVKHITVQRFDSGKAAPEVIYEIQKTTLPQQLSLDSVSIVAIETKHESKTSTKHWAVSSHEAVNQDQTALSNIACLLKHSKQAYSVCDNLNGEVFCFLPLSQVSGLPVHVSCNFAVNNNRRGIWTPDPAKNEHTEEVQWNIFLMKEAIPVAYANLLTSLKTMFENGILQSYAFYSLWPLSQNLKQKDPWETFVHSVYNLLINMNVFFSNSTSKWLMLQDCKFIESNIFGHTGTLPCVVKVLEHLNFPLVSLPPAYRTHLHLFSELIREDNFIAIYFDNLSDLSAIQTERNEVVHYLLRTYASTRENKPHIHQLLQTKFGNYACIPTAPDGAVLRKCTEVISPQASFAKLFEDSDHRFPIERLTDDMSIVALKNVGMMHSSLPWELIIDRAQSIQSLMQLDQLKALNRVRLILSTISVDEPPANGPDIDSIPFLPVMKKPEGYPLKWCGEEYELLPGSKLVLSGKGHLGSKASIALAGSQVSYLCEDAPSNNGCGIIYEPRICKILHLRQQPALSEVIAHLKAIIDCFNGSSISPDSTWIDQSYREIYSFFEKLLEFDGPELDLSELKSIPCIWNGKSFLSVNSVAVKWKMDGPYLYSTPPLVAANKNLLQALGIREKFDCEDAIRALKMMKNEFNDQPVDESCQELIAELMNIFAKLSPEELKIFASDVYLLNTEDILYLSTELKYNDAPWLPLDTECNIVSPKLSRAMATNLGVQLVRSALLDQYVSKKPQYFGTTFGQHEELTQRIKNIIREYTADITILKELLQNADDAKANKMYVILDKRTHGRESVISEEWQKLQGPAVLVWNDSTFSEDDLKGIQELGLGSKGSDSETIGQFGIGFNVVYHLTDCPSFVTGGDTLCVLDPHCRYVPEAKGDKALPGARYDELKDKFWTHFSDMASAYLQSGVDNLPEELLGGSLFRFPIRHTYEMVRSSKLIDVRSDEAHTLITTPEKLFIRMKSWMSDAKRGMFFLNHVNEIKFLVIEESSNSLQTICHFKAEIQRSPDVDGSLKTLHTAVSNFTQISGCDPAVALYPLTISDFGTKGKEKSEIWLIQQGIGDVNNVDQSWLLVKKAKPRHGLAAPLETSSEAAEDSKMKLFCFLPLPHPRSSGFPVHVNGNFVLSANRRGLWHSTDPEVPDDKARWNSHLFTAIASSYASFLSSARKYYLKSSYDNWVDAQLDMYKYYSRFPRFPLTDINKAWNSLACRVYRHLVQSNAEVLCVPVFRKETNTVDIEWHKLLSVHSEQVHYWYDTCGEVHEDIRDVLQDVGLKITSAPPEVMGCFSQVINAQQSPTPFGSEPELKHSEDSAMCKQIPYISAKSVFDYYTRHSSFSSSSGMQSCQIKETAFGSPERFLNFTKFLVGMGMQPEKKNGSRSSSECEDEYSYPESPFSHFLLLTANEELKPFNENYKVLNSKFCSLFPNHLDKFLHPILREILFDDNYFIACTAEEETAKKVSSVILEILDDTLPEELKNVEFIKNVPAIIEPETLATYWECFRGDSVFFSFLSHVLKHWALLLTTDSRLYSTTSDVLPSYAPSGDELLDQIFAIMSNLQMPFIETAVVSAPVQACAQLSDRKKTLSNFYGISQQSLLTTVLDETSIITLIKYFSSDAQPEKPEWVCQIKSLPLFKDINGDYQPIIDSEVYIWPKNACATGYSQWNCESNAIFLMPDLKWKSLGSPKQLSVDEISTEQLYTKYIFQSFEKLDEAARYEHLQFIKDCLYQVNKFYYEMKEERYTSDEISNKISTSKALINQLKYLRCIGSDESDLQPIRAFCDHTNEIFQVFSSEFQNLPEQLKSDDWLDFFRDLGLKVNLNESEYLELCRSVSSGKFESLVKCSSTLLDYIFSHKIATLWHKEENFLKQVSDIAFVVPACTSSVDWIAKSCCHDQQLVKLSGSASHKLINLMWTVRPLVHLPLVCTMLYNSDETKSLLQHMNISTSADIADVVENIKNICYDNPIADEKLFNNYPEELLPPAEQITDLCQVMLRNLKHLDSKSKDEAIKTLGELACIPVHCDLFETSDKKVVLVKPDCVVRYLSVEGKKFHPLLHEIPSTLKDVYTILEEIGVKSRLDLYHMQVVLEKIFTFSGGEKLDPNAKEHVKGAIGQLGEFLSRRCTVDATINPLYLPNVDDELKLSTSLLYCDSPSYMSQVKIDLKGTQYSHFNISEEEFGIDARTLCQMLPEKTRPLRMSEICQQVLDEGCQRIAASELTTLVQKSVQESDSLAVVKVFKKFTHHDATQNELITKFVTAFLSSLKIVTMNNLKTRIVLKEDETKIIGRVKADFYLDYKSGSEPVLYVDSSLDDEHDVATEISEKIYQCVMDNTTTVENVSWETKSALLNIIGNYLRAFTPSKKLNVLLRYQIDADINMKVSDISVEIGREIPECYHHRLEDDPHNIFHPMEFVGYEDKESHLIVAQIAHLVRPEEQRLQRMYHIHISKVDREGKEVSVLDLYKFLTGSIRPSLPLPEGDCSAMVRSTVEDKSVSLKTSLYGQGDIKLKEELCDKLKECWLLEPKLREKALRRLYLQYHPDKNLHDQLRATDIFTFIKKQVESLEKKGSVISLEDEESHEEENEEVLDNESEESDEEAADGSKSPSPLILESEQSDALNDSISDYYPKWDLRAKCIQAAQSLEQQAIEDDDAEPGISPLTAPLAEQLSEKKENPDEGERWVRQAEIDFDVLCALHSVAGTCNGYGHVCFMAQQVAEKAMKGAVYALCGMDGRDVADNKLTGLIHALQEKCPDKTEKLAENASALEDYFDKTRYPNCWPDCLDTPSEQYSEQDADQAKKHADAVLKIVRALVPSNEEEEDH